ncbi:MAG: hypothetical protein HRU09_17705 [Oligoflexales bacterium]|nr:hypothetical protein [Oligoflexales bacterium]
MEFKNLVQAVTICCLISASLTYAELNPGALKNTHDIILPQYQKSLSLASGLIYADAPMIPNILALGSTAKKSKLDLRNFSYYNSYSLADTLFFSPDGHQLGVNSGIYKLGRYLEASHIALILRQLLDFTNLETFKGELSELRQELVSHFMRSEGFPASSSYVKKFGESIDHFFTLLSDNKESHLISPSHLLLAFLWKKINSRAELVAFYRQLGEKYVKMELLDRETSPYIESDYQSLADLFKTQDAVSGELIEKASKTLNKEKLVYLLSAHDMYENKVPPNISYASADAPENVDSYPDCVETSLRYFLGSFIFESGKFDAKILKKGAHVSPRLVEYFERYSSINRFKSSQAHNDWSQVVSNLWPDANLYKNIKQSKDGEDIYYEIISKPANNIRVAYHLLFGFKQDQAVTDQPQDVEEMLTRIFDFFSDAERTFSWEIEGKSTDKKSLNILTLKDEEPQFTWEIFQGHSCIKIKNTAADDDWNDRLINYLISSDGIDGDYTYLFNDLNKLVQNWDILNSNGKLVAALLSSTLDQQEHLNQLVDKLANNEFEELHESILYPLFLKINANDLYARVVFSEALLKNNNQFFSKHKIDHLGWFNNNREVLGAIYCNKDMPALSHYLDANNIINPSDLADSVAAEKAFKEGECYSSPAYLLLEQKDLEKIKKAIDLGADFSGYGEVFTFSGSGPSGVSGVPYLFLAVEDIDLFNFLLEMDLDPSTMKKTVEKDENAQETVLHTSLVEYILFDYYNGHDNHNHKLAALKTLITHLQRRQIKMPDVSATARKLIQRSSGKDSQTKEILSLLLQMGADLSQLAIKDLHIFYNLKDHLELTTYLVEQGMPCNSDLIKQLVRLLFSRCSEI